MCRKTKELISCIADLRLCFCLSMLIIYVVAQLSIINLLAFVFHFLLFYSENCLKKTIVFPPWLSELQNKKHKNKYKYKFIMKGSELKHNAYKVHFLEI